MDIIELLNLRETAEIEWKAARGGLPKSIWETYSAFANTNGGTILLGVEESKDGYQVVGVKSEQILKDFWNTINNSQKISSNILSNHDVDVVIIDGLEIVVIYVPRAIRKQRPIYIGQNPFTGTFRRNYDGDYKCTEREVRAMLADQATETQDKRILPNYNIHDLNIDSVNSYRQRLSARNPGHPFLDSALQDFLFEIGAYGISRQTREEGLTAAGLLMFGKERCITDEFPNYFLDYRELMQENESQRWSHRVTSSDGTWSGNLYDFYFKIVNRLTDNINIPFKLDGLFRNDDTGVHVALREALVNTLVHADYYGERGIIIERHKTLFRFENPGNLRVSLAQALRGGVSDPRNAALFKMFTLLGIGERAGSGIPTIETAWKKQHWRAPEIIEEFQPERTALILRTVSLLPQESISFIKSVLGEGYQYLSQDDIFALVTAHQEGHVTNARLQYLLQQHSGDLTKLLQALVDKKLLTSTGKGRGTKYILSSTFINGSEEKHNEESCQHNEESCQHNEESCQHNEESCQHSERNEEFFIKEIVSGDEKLYKVLREIQEKQRFNPRVISEVVLQLCAKRPLRPSELAKLLNRQVETIKNHYVGPLVREGKLYPALPERTHPNQAYVSVRDDSV